MKRSHSTKTYPADKPIPKSVVKPWTYRESTPFGEKIEVTHSQAQRQIVKKIHSRRSRRFMKQIPKE